MEFAFIALVISLVFFLLTFTFAKTIYIKSGNSNYSHIPGPRKLPLIGNLHLLLRSATPHTYFRDLATKHGPLMYLQLGQVPFVIISSVETAREVMKTHDVIFANRPPGIVPEVLTYNYTDVGYAPYGEYWRQLRKICTLELLSARRVQLFQPIRREENSILWRWLADHEGSPVNVSERLFMLAYDITTRASLGQRSKDKGIITPLIRGCSQLASGLVLADLFPSVKILPYVTGLQFRVDRIYRKVRETFDGIIEEHRAIIAEGGASADGLEDLADVLLKLQQDGDQLQLTNGNITAVLMDMFIAGSETSAGVVEWTMSELMKNPDVLKKAQEEVREVFDGTGYVEEERMKELKYIPWVIAETLRLHPPLPFLVPRISSRRCEINGYEIPEKTRVLINSWALGRDPNHWDHPDKYMPERFEKGIDYKGNTYEYLPFGSGRRICPGMAFGLATVHLTLSSLLYHFDWELPHGITAQGLDMTEDFGATVARKNHLFLVPTLTRPLPSPAAAPT